MRVFVLQTTALCSVETVRSLCVLYSTRKPDFGGLPFLNPASKRHDFLVPSGWRDFDY